MKKLIAVVIAVIIVIAVFALMFNNRAQNAAKAKSVEKISLVPVSVDYAKIEKIDEKLSIIGTVNAVSEVNLVSETQGRVVSVNFEIGQKVSKGSLLAKVDDEVRQAQLNSAMANYEKTKKDFERYNSLFSQNTVNEAQFEQIKLAYQTTEANLTMAKRQYNDTKIKSPISGVITSRNIEPGSFLNINSPICYIVDVSSLKVKLNVPESDVFKLKQGDNVEVTTEIYPDKIFSGKIKSISAKGDEAHTYPVEVLLANNSASPLKAGMFARCSFNTVRREQTIVIPREALVGSARNPQVYVVQNGKAVLRNIVLGAESGDKFEALSGLNEGEMVVINGQINLQDGSSVKIAK